MTESSRFPPSRLRDALGLILFLAVSYTAAAIGSAFTFPAVDGWYQQLNRPDWTPPDWLFGPVWTVLYATMGIAAWMVWRRHGLAGARGALSVFLLQLVMNALWSVQFFGMQRPGLALAELLLLWLAILGTVMLFWHKNALAGLLLLPYLAWVSFAGALNLAIWQLNG
jgi:tryptophan-rich sensory protein